jgi:hypothetical protein
MLHGPPLMFKQRSPEPWRAHFIYVGNQNCRARGESGRERRTGTARTVNEKLSFLIETMLKGVVSEVF